MISQKCSLAVNTWQELKGWSHACFMDCLAIKCFDMAFDKQQHPETQDQPTILLVQPKAYTSKMCGACSNINNVLGLSKQYICPKGSALEYYVCTV